MSTYITKWLSSLNPCKNIAAKLKQNGLLVSFLMNIFTFFFSQIMLLTLHVCHWRSTYRAIARYSHKDNILLAVAACSTWLVAVMPKHIYQECLFLLYVLSGAVKPNILLLKYNLQFSSCISYGCVLCIDFILITSELLIKFLNSEWCLIGITIVPMERLIVSYKYLQNISLQHKQVDVFPACASR